LLSLAYLLSLGVHFDVVVNLDGFNEVALPLENISKGVFPFYPRNWFRRVGGVDSTMVRLMEKHALMVNDRQDWARLFSNTPLRFSVTANVLWKIYNRVLSNRIVNVNIAALNYRTPKDVERSYTVRGPRFRDIDEEETYVELAKMWRTASIQMYGLTLANGGTYVHFLQPNQYLERSKPLEAGERRKAFNEAQPYKRAVERGYPKLVAAGAELVQAGVPFYDLTMIFSHAEEPLYTDDCCHLGKEGYKIIASVIAARIAKHLERGRLGIGHNE
jgi:hypothetical protein